jgi:phytoene synthase
MVNAPPDAEQITQSSRSNLALALVALPRERRRDMTIFYAFCRLVDDLADSPENSPEKKRRELGAWKKAIAGPAAGEPALAAEVRGIIRKHRIPVEHFYEIIAGVEMDIEPARYQTFEELRLYCYRVASAVGLASIEIFGCADPGSKPYAIDLGLALQLTNILRDVGQDHANGGRIYLPMEDLERFGYSPDDLAAGRYNERFLELMDFEAARALSFYESAAREMPAADRRALVAAEIMGKVYGRLLDRMRRDRFHVFEKRYSLPRLQKLAIVAGTLLRIF